jgi:hypothetical protein
MPAGARCSSTHGPYILALTLLLQLAIEVAALYLVLPVRHPILIARLLPAAQGLRLERLSVMLPGSLRPICSGLDLELRPGE